MPWGLAHPAWLGLLGFIPLILALHMRRRRTRVVPSVMLVRARAVTGVPAQHHWSWPRPSVALALQVAALVAATLALAEPFAVGTEVGTHHVYVVDASASMAATDVVPSRFEDGLARVARFIERLEDGARVSVVAADMSPHLLVTGFNGNESLRAVLRTLRRTDGDADWSRTAEVVAAVVPPGDDARVVIVTDAQGAEAAAPAISAAGFAEQMHVEIIGTSATNVGLASATLGALPVPIESAALGISVQGTVLRSGNPDDVGLVSVTNVDTGQSLAMIEVVEAGGREGFEGLISLDEPGLVEIALAGDALAHDDRALFVVGTVPRTDVLVITAEAESAWERALRAIPGTDVTVRQDLPTDTDVFDLAVVDGGMIEGDVRARTVVWVDAGPVGSASGPTLVDVVPTDWNEEHRLSRGVHWPSFEVATARAVPELDQATTLVWADRHPLVQVRRTSAGAEIAIAFATADANWFDTALGATFVANIVRWIEPATGLEVRLPCQVGRACELPVGLLRDGNVVLGPDGSELSPSSSARVASSREEDLPRAFVDADTFVPDRRGVYAVQSDDGRVLYRIAVNALHAPESDLASVIDAVPALDAAAPFLQTVDIWRVLLLVAIMLIVADSLLSYWGGHRLAGPRAARGSIVEPSGFVLAVAVLLLVAAWARVPLPTWRDEGRTVLVLEALHDGAPIDPAEMRRMVGDLADSTNGESRAGIVLIGTNRTVTSTLPAFGLLTYEEPSLDLEGGIEAARAMLVGADPARIVLAASGDQTRGDVRRAIQALQASGIVVDVWPVASTPANEVRVTTMRAPRTAKASVPFVLDVLVDSEADVDATITLRRDGSVMLEQSVPLLAGSNRIEVPVDEVAPSTVVYTVDLDAPGDVIPENNHGGVVVDVEASPRVAVMAGEIGWGLLLGQALEIQGIRVDYLDSASAPQSLGGWLAYDVVVLMDVPSIDLHTRQQADLETWVREHGGGLLILGGESAFGPGGYYGTALDELSPLSSLIPRERPDVAVAFVIDRSGSMQQVVGNMPRLDIAREATWEAVQLLDLESEVAIIVFDSFSTLLYPRRQIEQLDSVRSSLDVLAAGGGTSMYPALVQAFDQLVDSQAAQRHIVLMTDGLSQAGDFEGVMERISSAGITLSAISVGLGSAYDRLARLAELGGGTYYDTNDFEALPSIMSQEMLLLTSDPVVNTSFLPQWADRPATFLENWPETLPELQGLVKTTAKPGATVHLRGHEELPLMASWRYGTGRVVAYSASGAGAWDAEWFARPDFPSLWSNVVRSLESDSAKPGFNVDVRQSGDILHVDVAALDREGDVAPGLRPTLTLLRGVDDRRFRIDLNESPPGHYFAEVALSQPGVYALEVRDDLERFQPVGRLHYVAYEATDRTSRGDRQVLVGLAGSTGGRVLTVGAGDLAGIERRSWRFVPQQNVLVAAAMALMVLGLALRYLPQLFTRGRHSS